MVGQRWQALLSGHSILGGRWSRATFGLPPCKRLELVVAEDCQEPSRSLRFKLKVREDLESPIRGREARATEGQKVETNGDATTVDDFVAAESLISAKSDRLPQAPQRLEKEQLKNDPLREILNLSWAQVRFPFQFLGFGNLAGHLLNVATFSSIRIDVPAAYSNRSANSRQTKSWKSNRAGAVLATDMLGLT